MFNRRLTLIPQSVSRTHKKDAIEWEIPEQVSVAFMFVENLGYTLASKVKVDKKHWWNRSWKAFMTHAPTPAEAIAKGMEFLESYGYTIDYDEGQFEDMISNPDSSPTS